MEHLTCAQATRLSDRQLKAVKPKDKDYLLSDGDGLQLRVRVNGSTLWNFNYRQPITENRINMGLGTYSELSLAQARKKTVEARELLAQGIDPKEQRSALEQTKRQATEHTFENVASAWFELKKDSVTQAYAEDIWRSLALHAFSSLGTTPISQINAPRSSNCKRRSNHPPFRPPALGGQTYRQGLRPHRWRRVQAASQGQSLDAVEFQLPAFRHQESNQHGTRLLSRGFSCASQEENG